MAEADEVDKIIDQWKDFKNDKKQKPRDWCLFYNNHFGPAGNGFESFQKALISISLGRGWVNRVVDEDGKVVEPGKSEFEEDSPARAYPVIGLYKQPAEDNEKRIKILCFGYCDDNGNFGTMLKGGKKKMTFANAQNEAKENWFEGIKGPKVMHWGSEADITEQALKDWFADGDRV